MADVARAPLALRFGVIVPCRNEAAVVERKLANLARLEWPYGTPARVVVVDDGSSDGTAERARTAARILSLESVSIEVVPNRGPAGKASAVATGLAALGEDVDVVLLTDADVVLEPDAPAAFARAFDDPAVGMVSGAQEFVASLADDGSCRAADGGVPAPAGSRFDRVTARVRRLESRCGRVFSVHGQALAWRRDLALVPPRGFVADDIELMLQVRAAGRRVVVAPDARFLELKVPPGDARDSQVRRRAAGYFHLVRRTAHPLRGGALDRAQWLCYRWLPGAAPLLAVVATAAPGAVAWLALGPVVGLGAQVAAVAAWFTVPGADLARLLSAIARGSREERTGTVSDSWEMARP